jgi:hypothetical protein
MNQLSSALLGASATSLFIGLGWMMAQPAQALQVPIGIGLGSIPYFSVAGSMNHSSTTELASDSAERVITDLILTTSSFCGAHGYQVTLVLGNGDEIGHFKMSSAYANDSGNYQSNLVASLNSGLRIPAGEALYIANTSNYQDCKTGYTLAGYFAQP